MITIRSSGKSSISRGPTSIPSGTSMCPSVRPMPTFLRIERPTSATLRSSAVGGVDDLLDAVDVGGEARHDDPPLAAREDLLQVRPDDRLRGREALAVDVGRVAAQQQHALAPELRQARDVGGRPVDGRLVELVVAGEQDRPELSAERDRAGVGDRVGHVHQLERERPELERSRPARRRSARRRAACAPRAWSAPSPSSAARRRPAAASPAGRARAAPTAARRGGPRGRA